MSSTSQLKLFQSTSFNPTYEIKRQIRLALGNSSLSRDEVVDRMNEIAVAEGMRKKVSKAILDGWAKDSDPDRLPSLPCLTIFCRVMDTTGPLNAMANPLGYAVIGAENANVLAWGQAELHKRRAAKRARMALDAVE